MLHVHRAERADGLVEALGDLLAEPLEDPFAAEIVAVPTRGMERWLTQRLSDRLGAGAGRGDGVCANVAFPSPRRVVAEAVAVASGIEPDADPWLPERAVWPLLEVAAVAAGEPWLAPLTRHLDDGAGRFGTLRHVAELFDRYAVQRPQLVQTWAAGDGLGWQARLWRELRERVGVASPAERLAPACDALRARPEALELPRRIALFGLTRLPAAHLAVLDALAAARDVHLLLLHPSPALWDAVAGVLAGRGPVRRRAEDPTRRVPVNRLLASWGQDTRELQLVLGSAGAAAAGHHHPLPAQAPATLLARLQADVRADRRPPGRPLPGRPDERPRLDPADRSVEVHACHGRARQVEALRDAILHALAADPGLEPRDVIVMCPDIEAFAPLIGATFGAGEVVAEDAGEAPAALPAELRPPDLRVRLADRALRQTNPVLGVVARLIELAERRVTASEVLDLAGREPVRRRFALDDDDLARLEEWTAASGIRWGLDAAHRAPFSLDGQEAGTWRFGLDRVLVGVTMTEDRRPLVHDVLPLDDVDSGAIDLAGRFAELVDRLQRALDAFAAPMDVDGWAAALAVAADALTVTAPRDAWQRAELGRLLGDVVAEASAAGDGGQPARLDVSEVRALLADRLAGRPTRANFRTGHLTVCTLMPMRSVPHRVVCLLGLDDGVFPRRAPRDGDDLALADPHVGDRDGRAEDRQLLLDALMAATDKLVVTYAGRDERTNLERPPAVPVGELLDAVDRTVRAADGDRARDQVLVHHPLQPFDPRNFTPGELAPGTPWSFDRVTLGGARRLSGPRTPPGPFLHAPLPPDDRPVLELEELVRFVQHPVRTFLRRRLGISVGDFSDELEDALPIELDGLDRWAIGQRLLDAQMAGVEPRAAALAERARGLLPPGVLGYPVVADLLPTVARLVEAAEPGGADAVSVDVRVALAGGRVLAGTVPGVVGDALRSATFSRLGARHRLAAWVRLLALAAAHPARPFVARTVGRSPRGEGVLVACIGPLEAAAAVEHLTALADLFDRGMREPLPLVCAASAAYAQAVADGLGEPARAAGDKWTSGWSFDGEDRDPAHALVWGELALDELLAGAAMADEAAWSGERSRFGAYARRLWDPLLAAEELRPA